ncbi:MAG: hypothetical protein HYS06_09080 [Methylocystis sp.]|nr:hypothetical protein [Methylocystis sp.]
MLVRFLGLLLLAGGFAALIVDGTRSLAAGQVLVTPLSKGAAQLFPAGLPSLQAAIEQHISAFLWDPVIVTLLTAPASVALSGAGALLILFSRKHRAPIGYASR